MRLFISYARVDKPYCQQIIDTLDVHDVWYDHRLHAGQKWWTEIVARLSWCEGFVYLLSPDSINSKYCQQEFQIAQKLGKHIFPVMIHARTPLPEALEHFQYADLSKGLSAEAVKMLLNAIYIAERHAPVPQVSVAAVTKAQAAAPVPNNPHTLIDEAAQALDSEDFDRAVFLLKQAREQGYSSRFVNIEAVLQDAEAALERQAYLREAEREYQPIVALIKHDRTRKHGCEAFVAFRQQFPNYDPENLSSICATAMLPMLEWCAVPEGAVTMTYEDRKVIYALPPFRISKYPITNAQYQVFIDAPDGYCEPRWWAFSDDAKTWHSQHPDPLLPRFNWGDHPRANVCWFEAMAFCHWLSARSGLQVTLPTEQQWQRAAQGDDGRPYPWGTKFDKARANTKEAFLRMTTSVTRFPNGVSPFGLLDMAGNVWEWCGHVNGKRKPGEVQMPVRGGSFMSVAQRSRIDFRFMLSPVYRYASIGFRVVCRAG